MPTLIFGTFNIASANIRNALEIGIKAGYRHIDTASIYGNEDAIGDALQDFINSGKISRKELYIIGKPWLTHHRDIRPACINSLSRLKLSYFGQYLLHWPLSLKPDGKDPPVFSPSKDLSLVDYYPLYKIWEQMEKLQDEGLVKSIGVSNFTIALLQDMLGYSRIKPETNEIEISIFNPQHELVDFCHLHKIVPLGYRVIYNPINDSLSKFKKCALEDQVVIDLSRKYHVDPAQLLIAWCLARNCGVIVKSETPKRIIGNFEAQKLILEKEDIEKLSSVTTNGVYCDPYESFGIHLLK
ncbi:unnamed protein product [Blepharisma stoltei]|uniref:NADP-dependent oxidoreductase domain-containing protein n=1 Tax=Blepharisma stoltei TaxID=1481888 RepID=A0AAU9KCY3_9CILI|nr:unnamed protein product [Blepharisma stoltei]